MDVQLPDGTVISGVPDGMSKADLTAKLKANGYDVSKLEAPSVMGAVKQQAGNIAAGLVRGAGSIGATLLAPVDMAKDALNGKGLSLESNRQRRADMDSALGTMGADTSSIAYAGGKLAGEIAGTAGAGGAAANVIGRLAPGAAAAAPNVLNAIRTAGMSGGNIGARTVGGTVTGGLSAFMVNPEDAGTGALVGGALPGATKLAGMAGQVIGAGARKMLPAAAPEVAALADRAAALGIDVPADRIVNSKPLNALAATLNYVPFSGRAGTEQKMVDGLNRALSRTFGQNSENVTQALRSASADLGGQFDTVLQANTVKLTPAFRASLAEAENQATNELGPEAASIIHKQIAQLQTKGAAGEIDGRAAYNIKKALDRIGGGNSDAAFYARDLKKRLMEALNESLGPQEAASFATLRKQYGNMLALENLAQNGAEGGVSAARLANMKNIGNPDLQELADIAAQFMRTRESPHGALQRLVIGGAATGAGGLPYLPAAAAAGRGANALLNSNTARNYVTGRGGNALAGLLDPEAVQFGYRAAPVLAGGR